jgi:uncharacterized protein
LSGAIDVNLLLYAIDEKSPFHRQTLRFFEDLFSEGLPLYVTWDVIHSFLRIATNPRIFVEPLTPLAAIANIKKTVDHPLITMLSPSLESWNILAALTEEFHLRGNLIPDAVTASILQANGIKKIYTHDRDLWKFPALKPVDPFEHPGKLKEH